MEEDYRVQTQQDISQEEGRAGRPGKAAPAAGWSWVSPQRYALIDAFCTSAFQLDMKYIVVLFVCPAVPQESTEQQR